MKLIQYIILVLIVMTATTNLAFSQSSDTVQLTDSAKVVSIKVKGITCGMDLKMISANVEKLEGVSTCQTVKQGTTTTFEVKYIPTLVAKKEIYATIEGTGSCENPDERPYKVKQ